jgi:hypothetical protein
MTGELFSLLRVFPLWRPMPPATDFHADAFDERYSAHAMRQAWAFLGPALARLRPDAPA